jgi:starch synthase
MIENKLNILFVAPEVVPFAKTGGLGDVAGSLPPTLKRLGADVRIVTPYYRSVQGGDFRLQPLKKDLAVPLGDRWLPIQVMKGKTVGGVPVYLIEREDLYDRPNLYGNNKGDYYDNLERFSFFSHAALRIAEALPFTPDVVHCHDWQTGLVPALLRGPYRSIPIFEGAVSVFTVHNIGYQGIFPPERLSITGLPPSDYFNPEGLEFWGNFSLLKAGLVYSEAITTVSPRYAQEIQSPEYGMGMEGIFRHRKAFLHGILNGVDYRLWNPAGDPEIPAHYSPGRMDGKRTCKASLIQEMGLDPSLQDRPLLGMISRLDDQKGLDLLLRVLGKLLALDVGLVVLGSGHEKIQKALQKASDNHPGRLGLRIGFDEALAHRIMAGIDVLLIPSRYEPCGLTQMYALKYGTIPLVRATGGLDDTVTPFDPKTGEGNGFKFVPFEPRALLDTLGRAVDLFKDSRTWNRIVKNGMKADFSWERSARSYMELYQSIVRR